MFRSRCNKWFAVIGVTSENIKIEINLNIRVGKTAMKHVNNFCRKVAQDKIVEE